MTKLFWSFFGLVKGHVTRGHKSYFAFSTFSTNRHIIREPEELQRRAKAHSIVLLTLFRQGVLSFDLSSKVWPPSPDKN